MNGIIVKGKYLSSKSFAGGDGAQVRYTWIMLEEPVKVFGAPELNLTFGADIAWVVQQAGKNFRFSEVVGK